MLNSECIVYCALSFINIQVHNMYVLAHIYICNHNYVRVYHIVGFIVFLYVKRLEDSFTVIRRYINTLLLLYYLLN